MSSKRALVHNGLVTAVLASLALLAGPALGQEDPAAEPVEEKPGIRIRVSGLRSDEGSLICGLFVEESWLRAVTAQGEGGKIEAGAAECWFRDVEPGTYAISTYHDENGNGQLDTGFMRIPKEGTAASHNAWRKFGPPRYRDAKFDYEGGALELEAEMRYIRGGKKNG